MLKLKTNDFFSSFFQYNIIRYFRHNKKRNKHDFRHNAKRNTRHFRHNTKHNTRPFRHNIKRNKCNFRHNIKRLKRHFRHNTKKNKRHLNNLFIYIILIRKLSRGGWLNELGSWIT